MKLLPGLYKGQAAGACIPPAVEAITMGLGARALPNTVPTTKDAAIKHATPALQNQEP